MIQISFFTGEVIFALIWILVRVVLWKCRGKIDWKREAILFLMYINLAVILRFTFFPFAKVNGKVQPLLFDASSVFSPWINLEPFVHLNDYVDDREAVLNFVGNIAMFIPTGIILPVIYKRLNGFWKVIGTGFLISLCIEIIQLPFYGRWSDIDDLILNTSGVVIGYMIYALLRGLMRAGRKEKAA